MTQTDPIYVLGKQLELFQPVHGFKTSLDSVMLAAACLAGAHDHVLDMGCGVGSAGLCVLSRIQNARLTGVEIQNHHYALAIKNASHNQMDARADFVCADIRNFEAPRFDHIICNPPYMEAGHHLVSPYAEKAQAHGHQDTELTLQDWMVAGHRLLKSGGSFTIIHRADMADKIIAHLHGPKRGRRFGAMEIIPLWPKTGRVPKRVIIRAIKDRQSPALIHTGITLHNDDGRYTVQAERILRGSDALV